MNILIVSEHFYPATHIAVFRITAFAKYLKEAGHNVTVVTEWDDDRYIKWNGCDVYYVKNRIITRAYIEDCAKRLKRWTVRKIINAVLVRITLNPLTVSWQHRAYRKIAAIHETTPFDIILTSYPCIAPHLIAIKLREKGYKFYWIADMRDEMSKYYFRSGLYRRRIKPYERKIINTADLTLSVSRPIIEDFRSLSDNGNFLEIRNGYDYEEIHDVRFQSRFTMSYIGNFYCRLIRPDNWFRAFSELIRDGLLPADSRIRIVGNCRKIDIPKSIASNVVQIGRVSHSEAIRISAESDVLVVVHQTGRKGVYTGKIFDYLATNKPILALCDPQDVVGKLLNDTHAGFTVDNSDIEGIKEYILRCYSIWKNKEIMPRNWDVIRLHTRKQQVQRLIDYIDSHKEQIKGKQATQ